MDWQRQLPGWRMRCHQKTRAMTWDMLGAVSAAAVVLDWQAAGGRTPCTSQCCEEVAGGRPSDAAGLAVERTSGLAAARTSSALVHGARPALMAVRL